MVNSFCGKFLLQSHAALHGEFLLVLHTLCWFMRGAPLACPRAGLYGEFLLHAQCWFIWQVSLTCPVLLYMWSFSYMPSAGLRVEFLLHTPCWLLSLGSFSHKVYAGFFWSEFLLYKTKRKNVKVNKNVHNWVMLLFKAEADIHCWLHKVASRLPADSAEINTNMKWVPVKQ